MRTADVCLRKGFHERLSLAFQLKRDRPVCVQGLTIGPMSSISPAMYGNRTISTLLKALWCFAFALMLVMSPLTASHAASGMHGDHHTLAAQTDHQEDKNAHGSMLPTSPQDVSGSEVLSADQDATSENCCNGICISVVLDEAADVFVVRTKSGRYLTLHAQTTSIEPSGFLRPPQFLI